jgi:Zn-dependent protease
MDANLVFTGAVQILLLLLSISAHEAAHTWMADRCGDSTGRLAGRLTLNPLVHVDLFGSLVMPLTLVLLKLPVFGWGRPTFVMSKNLRRRGRDDALVAAAGPAANLVLAILAAAALLATVAATGTAGWRSALVALNMPAGDPHGGLFAFPLLFTLSRLASINALLGLFNLMPLPPFDGGRMLYHLLPPPLAARFAGMPGYGLMIAMAVVASGILVLLLMLWVALTLGIFLFL